ncbi:MAG: ACP S-malonyltransferase [Gammaproteobacteria bacterium]|nr:ACP S-malonyltransferase [Gammaproteobacteria bacterium]
MSNVDQQHILFVFPGQGSQYRGMGSDLCQEFATARRIYEEASAVLGYDIAKLSFEDADDQLNLTRYTQPALLTHSIACLEVFRELTDNRVIPAVAAGHSLGEYSALVAVGSLSFAEALLLVRRRGEFMGTYGEGEMLAFPLEVETVRPLAEKHYCGIGGCNLPDQTVVGGRAEDLDRVAEEVAASFPRKRAVRLKTEGAFHTYLMVEAARHFRPVLDAAEMAVPPIRVLSNYTGDYHLPDAHIIKSRLFFQLFHPVRWIWNMRTALNDGIDTFVEFGGGIGTGETPDAKRPNLESILKKASRSVERETRYYPAINSRTLRETAAAFDPSNA